MSVLIHLTNKAAIVVIIAFLITLPFCATLFLVRGDSMVHAFENHDVLLVDRISLSYSPPRRGEVVVIHNPHKPDETVIKRVIGLPGERIIVGERDVRIVNPDGSAREYVGDVIGGGTTGDNVMQFNILLGPEDYFVMGDNRQTSLDSRLFGAVQPVNFIGRPIARIFPFSRVSLAMNN